MLKLPFEFLVVEQYELGQKSDLALKMLPCHSKCCSVALSALDVPSSLPPSLSLSPPPVTSLFRYASCSLCHATRTRPIPSISPPTEQPNNQQAPSPPPPSPPWPSVREKGSWAWESSLLPFLRQRHCVRCLLQRCTTLPLSPRGLFALLIL